MSEIKTLGGGYKGGSPRVRSSNTKTYVEPLPQQKILVSELINQIKVWKVDGKLTSEEIQTIITELQKI
jgi:hypothetical protein|tara:strand:+ start:1020 stop:1226 length:207 start_codon:yes stop_codon:yes gene_type:complete